MPLAQMRALTGGRKIKPSYVAEINERARYLPSLYSQRSAQKHADRMYGLEQQNLELAQDAAQEAKKKRQLAEKLGYGNIALTGGLGAIRAYPAIKEVGKDIIDFVSPEETISSLAGGSSEAIKAPFEQGMEALDFLSSDYVSPALKYLGDAALNFGGGIYDNVVGDIIDIDFDESFGEDFGGLWM